MNILLISQCDKRALSETRRILDQFAERRGDRTWQTPITRAGLDTLRRLLRKTARRNTAVACHWIRGLDHSELLWVVGDASRFNTQGSVPTHTTKRNVLRREDENDWHNAEDIQLLARMAALLHDLGKACASFQARLSKPAKSKNLYRHEWISLRLFQAFVGDDDDTTWLQRLIAPTPQDDASWLAAGRLMRDGLDAHTPPPFRQLPPLAAAIGWLVLSHHRLPVVPNLEDERTRGPNYFGKPTRDLNRRKLGLVLENITHQWNELHDSQSSELPPSYWQFDHGLPVTEPKWRAKAAKVATKLLALCNKPGKGDWLNNPYVMHLARLSLMLGDHYYSSLGVDDSRRVKGDGRTPLYANTDRDGKPKQALDEHLLGVDRMAASIVHALPRFERHLPHLIQHKGLRKRSGDERFRWQDQATDKAAGIREASLQHGAFIINMASTGCGKTLANARIMNALAEPQRGLRCAFALGLRTLTRQTGESYRHDLHLGDDELAIRVGGSDAGLLQQYFEAQHETHGSASIQSLIDEDSHVFYEGNTDDHGLLGKAMGDPAIRAMLAAPMLVCTIDHLMPATEAQRGGRQIAPMLRLMSGDLVLDEVDDFDIPDQPAVTRLVYWAGLLGARVLLSTATISPGLANGLFQAYRAGRQHFRRNRGEPVDAFQPEVEIPCLWVDEYVATAESCRDAQTFADMHTRFVSKRAQTLVEKGRVALRLVEIRPWNIPVVRSRLQVREHFAGQLQLAMQAAHTRHAQVCPHSGKRVSFGLIRMANINPLFDVALTLFKQGSPAGQRIHLCVYHAGFSLILRSAIEAQLDRCLNRKQPFAVFDMPDVRQALDSHPEQEHLFVVLGSPVTEVGRDHDYDWAIVEPSSMRSLVQLAGRVQRHRRQPCSTPNLLVFDTNLKHYENQTNPEDRLKPAFIHPGFEIDRKEPTHRWRLSSHRLDKLLRLSDYLPLTAAARILPRPLEERDPKNNLVDLEHARIDAQMLPGDEEQDLNAACAWQYPQTALTWVLPQHQPFREQKQAEANLVFRPDEAEERLVLYRLFRSNPRAAPEYLKSEERLERIPLEHQLGDRILPWGKRDLAQMLDTLADELGLPLSDTAERFTPVQVADAKAGWRFHPALGLTKNEGG